MKFTPPTGYWARNLYSLSQYAYEKEHLHLSESDNHCRFARWYYERTEKLNLDKIEYLSQNQYAANQIFIKWREEMDRAIVEYLVEHDGVVDSFPDSETENCLKGRTHHTDFTPSKDFLIPFDYFGSDCVETYEDGVKHESDKPVYRCTELKDSDIPSTEEHLEHLRKNIKAGASASYLKLPPKQPFYGPWFGRILGTLVMLLLFLAAGTCVATHFFGFDILAAEEQLRQGAYTNSWLLLPAFFLVAVTGVYIIMDLHAALFWIGLVVLVIGGFAANAFIQEAFKSHRYPASLRKYREYKRTCKEIEAYNREIKAENKRRSAEYDKYLASKEYRQGEREREQYCAEVREMYEQFHKAWYEMKLADWKKKQRQAASDKQTAK